MDEQAYWIELLGVTMAGSGEPDRGLIWTNLQGWRGLPDKRGETSVIPGGHGRFARSSVLRESRVITVIGHVYAADNAELHAVADRLEAQLGAGGVGEMKVSTPGGGTWSREVEIDTLTIDPDRGRRWTKFTIDMLAPDPRRYGPRVAVGPVTLPQVSGGVRFPQRAPFNFGRVSEAGRLILPNSGALSMFPVVRVEGGFTEVTVRSVTTGRSVVLPWPVGVGEDVLFDMGKRRATAGGVDVTRWMTRRQWLEVPAGETHELRFEVLRPQGTPQMWAEYQIGAW